jgi:GNAT superfamily N-acetyltransferase
MRVYRKLLPYEIWRLREHLLRLSPADRRLRFFTGAGTEFIAAHCRRIDGVSAVVVGFFESGVLRGAAELHLVDAIAGLGELAVTVEHDWQDRQIGTTLLDHAITIAENRGVRSIEMICLVDNGRMQHVARKFAERLVVVDNEAAVEVKVPFPTQLSLWREAVSDGIAFMTSWLEQLPFPMRQSPVAPEVAARQGNKGLEQRRSEELPALALQYL